MQMVQNEQAKAVLANVFPITSILDDNMLAAMGEANLREMATMPYLILTSDSRMKLTAR